MGRRRQRLLRSPDRCRSPGVEPCAVCAISSIPGDCRTSDLLLETRQVPPPRSSTPPRAPRKMCSSWGRRFERPRSGSPTQRSRSRRSPLRYQRRATRPHRASAGTRPRTPDRTSTPAPVGPAPSETPRGLQLERGQGRRPLRSSDRAESASTNSAPATPTIAIRRTGGGACQAPSLNEAAYSSSSFVADLDQAGDDRQGVERRAGTTTCALGPDSSAATSQGIAGEEQEPHPVRQHVPALPDVPDRVECGQREGEGKREGDGERRQCHDPQP